MTLILLSTSYDKEKNIVILGFYDTVTKQMVRYEDKTNFRPYCLTDYKPLDFYLACYIKKSSKNLDLLPTEVVEKFNPITKKIQQYTKLIGKIPQDISDPFNSGGRNIVSYLEEKDRDKIISSHVWENDIYIQYNYLYDYNYYGTNLVIGMPYTLKLREVEIKESIPCPKCGKTYRNYDYYSLNLSDNEEDQKNKPKLILGNICCASCKSIEYSNPELLMDDYTLLFTVNAEAYSQIIKKKILIPIASNTELDPQIKKDFQQAFKNESKEEQELVEKWAPFFFSDIPTDIYRTSMDIEVAVPEGDDFPNELKAEYPVSDVQFISNTGKKICFLLKVWKEEGEPFEKMDKDNIIKEYVLMDEKKMLQDVFQYIATNIPILVTFNGNNFDLPYLYHRAIRLKIPKDEIPIIFTKKRGALIKYSCSILNGVIKELPDERKKLILDRQGIHLDLYCVFSNRSLKAYAFKNAYVQNNLRSVTTALLSGETKVDETLFEKEQTALCYKCNKRYISDNGNKWYELNTKLKPTIPNGKNTESKSNINQKITLAKELLNDYEDEDEKDSDDFISLNDIDEDNENDTNQNDEDDENAVFFIKEINPKDNSVIWKCPDCGSEIKINKKKKNMEHYTKNELMYYCFIDTDITLKLTTYGNFIVIQLLFILMRLSKTGLEDFILHQISFWLKNLFFYEHRQTNWLIPQDREIRHITKACTESVGDKQFQGGYVTDTIRGIHFGIIVMDFASLYPSLIKTRNLSYETVDCCDHDDCKQNIIPETTHWVCKHHQGKISLILGFIRDVRVYYFKEKEGENKKIIKKLKEEKKDDEALKLKQLNEYYGVIQSALKVFINAGYGVFASQSFHFYQIGMAESVTASGRYSTKNIIIQCKENAVIVVGGDSIDGTRCIAIKRDNKINVIPIEKLWENEKSSIQYIEEKEIKNPIELYTLSKNGQWERIKQIIRHKTSKQLYQINQKNGETICTEDHSLIDINYNPIKPTELGNNKIQFLQSIPIQEQKLSSGIIDLYPLLKSFKIQKKYKKQIKIMQWHLTSDNTLWFGWTNRKEKITIDRFCNITDLCKLLGFYEAEGHASLSCNRMTFGLSNKNIEILEELIILLKNMSNNHIIKIIQTDHGIRNLQNKYIYDQTCYAIRSSNNTITALFMSLCGSNSKYKKIPEFIFNIDIKYQQLFYQYYLKGDGSIEKNRNNFTTKSLQLASGFCFLLKSWNIDTGIYHNEKKDVYRIRERTNDNDEANPIKTTLLKLPIKNQYVYDLSVENTEMFVDCCGMLLLHNTDSVFLKKPSKEFIEFLKKWSDDNLHVQLDVDGEYRFIAMSDRKKNYIGFNVQPKGTEPSSPLWKKPNMKGVKAKKSNTPPFLKEDVDVVIKYLDHNIMTEEQIEEAKEYMKKHLIELIKKIMAGQIAIEKMVFYQKLSKNLEDYSEKGAVKLWNDSLIETLKSKKLPKALENNVLMKNEFEKVKKDQNELRKWIYSRFQTKGMNQGSKCALLLNQKGERLGKDDFVTFLKVKIGDGALPIDLFKSYDQIDIKKYISEIESTYEQIYDCFGLDTKEIVKMASQKTRATTLDSLFNKK